MLNCKTKNEKKNFWIYFDLKPTSKNESLNFRFHFLIWNQKMNFKKLFHFSIFVLKLKNGKWKIFKIHFVFRSKIILSVHGFHFVSWIRAPKVPFNFQFKIEMEKDIFANFNFDSKLKIEKRFFIFNFQFLIENWKTKSSFFIFQFSFYFKILIY